VCASVSICVCVRARARMCVSTIGHEHSCTRAPLCPLFIIKCCERCRGAEPRQGALQLQSSLPFQHPPSLALHAPPSAPRAHASAPLSHVGMTDNKEGGPHFLLEADQGDSMSGAVGRDELGALITAALASPEVGGRCVQARPPSVRFAWCAAHIG